MIAVDSLLATWRARSVYRKTLYRATGPEGWEYAIDTPGGFMRHDQWRAWAGRAISYTVDLGNWPTFEMARAACEEHAIRSQGVTVEVRP